MNATARERSRDGLTALNWAKGPSASEAWPDKIRVQVRGTIRWDGRGSFLGYLGGITPNIFFRDRPTPGREFSADVKYGPGLSGDLQINMRSGAAADALAVGQAGFTLKLNVNPTIIRALAVRRNVAPLDSLGLHEFFRPGASWEESNREGPFVNPREWPLDRAENVLLSPAELGGTALISRTAARNEFLRLLEANLRSMVHEMLEPRFLDDGPEMEQGDYRVETEWSKAKLQYAEIYFERRSDDPVSVMRRLYDRGLDLARRIKAQTFADVSGGGRPVSTTYRVEQDDGYPHLVIPLIGERNIELSIYAKTNLRVRFEVKYRSRFSDTLKGCSEGEDRLTSLLLRLSEDAAKRLTDNAGKPRPWRELARVIATPPEVDIGDISALILQLLDATGYERSLFRPVVHQLLITGGVFEDDDRHPGIANAIRRLERAGVLDRWVMQLKEEKRRRRYGLSNRYAAVRHKMIAGFIPVGDANGDFLEPQFLDDEDHYEENARLMGGRQGVERPYDR